MKFTWRFEIPNLIQDRTAGLQSLGGLIQPPPLPLLGLTDFHFCNFEEIEDEREELNVGGSKDRVCSKRS